MVNILRLKAIIVEKGTTQEAVAESIGMDRSTFYRKVKNGGKGFTVGEIQRIVEAVPLTNEEAMLIFFNNTVA